MKECNISDLIKKISNRDLTYMVCHWFYKICNILQEYKKYDLFMNWFEFYENIKTDNVDYVEQSKQIRKFVENINNKDLYPPINTGDGCFAEMIYWVDVIMDICNYFKESSND